MDVEPLVNGSNGEGERGSDGRFLAGNRAAVGHGSPHGQQAALLRRTLLDKVTPAEIAQVVGALLEAAKKGDTAAAKLLFSYTLGDAATAREGSKTVAAVQVNVNSSSLDALQPIEVSESRRQDYESFLRLLKAEAVRHAATVAQQQAEPPAALPPPPMDSGTAAPPPGPGSPEITP